MQSGLPFVIFGAEWGRHPSSTEHLARQMARTNPILYVNAIGTRRPTWSLYDARRALGHFQRWISTGENILATGLSNGQLYSPILLPFNNFGPIRSWNRRTLVRGLRREIEAHVLERPILFVAAPIGAEVVGAIGERLLIYYVADQYRELPLERRGHVTELERILLDQADLILVSSLALLGDKHGRKTQPHLLPHGVDFEHFHSAAEPLGPMPEDLKGLPRPIFGFFGLLAPWVDFNLLEHLGRAFSSASVLLIGPKWGNCKVPSLPNLHWLGSRSYDDLPRYGAHFDVALIPFHHNRLTSYANPLKLLEYMALGLPIVSTPLPDLSRFAEEVFEAGSPEEFVSKAELALARCTPEHRRRRYALAAQETWEARATALWGHIQQALQTRKVLCTG
jgi:glycosyltransferase involved in cell wall biosynthesis